MFNNTEKKTISLYTNDFIQSLVKKKDHSSLYNICGQRLDLSVYNQTLDDNIQEIIKSQKNHEDPKYYMTILSEYYIKCFDIIYKNNGYVHDIDHFSIQAVFGIKNESYEIDSVKSAIEIKNSLFTILDKYINNTKEIKMQIGINSGSIVIFNMGSEQRMFNKIEGDESIYSSILMNINKNYGSTILISENIQSKIKDSFIIRKLDKVRTKLFPSKYPRIYEVLDYNNKDINIFNSGIELFEKKEWIKAKEQFKKYLDINSDDNTTKYYINKCNTFIQKPPSELWDGIFNIS